MSIRILAVWLLLLFVAVSPAYAFGEKVDYDADQKLYTIDTLLGSKLIELKLLSSYCTSPVECEAQVWVKPTSDIVFNEKFLFQFFNSDNKETGIRDYNFEILTATTVYDQVKDKCTYKEVDNPYMDKKTMQVETCTYKNVSRVVNEYLPLNPKTTLKADTGMVIKLHAFRSTNKVIDWIPTVYNQKLDNWAWWSATWEKRIQLNATGGASTLSNFPLYVEIPLTTAQARWYEIKLANETSEMDICIDDYNTTAIMAWVNVPSFATGVNDVGFIYYSNTSAVTANEDCAGVFQRFNLTYLFGSGIHGTITDLSESQANLTKTGNLAENSTFTSSVFGTSNTFFYGGGSGHGNHLSVAAPANIPTGNTSYTIIFWGQTHEVGTRGVWEYGTNTNFAATGYATHATGTKSQIMHWTDWDFSADDDHLNGAIHPVAMRYIQGTEDVYVDTVSDKYTRAVSTLVPANNNLHFGKLFDAHGYSDANASMDMWTITSEYLSENYIDRALKNNNTGMVSFGDEEIPLTSTITVTLNTPTTPYNTSATSIAFNCSASSPLDTLVNITLEIWRDDNTLFYDYTEAAAGSRDELTDTVSSFTEDTYYWNCFAEDDLPNSTYALSNSTIIVDQTAPTIILNSPDLQVYNNSNISIGFTATDAGTGIQACKYNTGGANTSLACSNASFVSGVGVFDFTLFVNDSAGNEGSASNTYGLYNITSITFDDSIEEGEYDYINISVDFNFSYNADTLATTYLQPELLINGTETAASYIDGTASRRNFQAKWTAPFNSSASIYNFYFNLTFANATDFEGGTFSSTSDLINVSIIQVSNCVFNPDNVTYNVSMRYAEDRTPSSAALDYVFTIWKDNPATTKTLNGTSAAATEHYFCIEPASSSLNTDVLLEFQAPAFSVKRSYYIRNASISNTTIPLSLYLLNSTLSTTFLIEVQDEYFSAAPNFYVEALRYYPDINSYLVTEVGRTNIYGETLLHLYAEVPYYKFLIYDYGTLKREVSGFKPICVGGSCELTFIIQPDIENYFKPVSDNTVYSIRHNNNTGIITYTWADSSGTTSSAQLIVKKVGVSSDLTLCDSTVAASSGTINCNISGNGTGSFIALPYITQSPETFLDVYAFTVETDYLIFGSDGMFWAILIIMIISIMGLAFGSPIVALMLPTIVLMLLTLVGIISIPYAVLVGIFVAVLFLAKSFRG